MKENELIKKFRRVGFSILNVDIVIEQWKSSWFISQFEDEYRFVSANGMKVRISPDQAKEVIKKLSLTETKSTIVKGGSMWEK